MHQVRNLLNCTVVAAVKDSWGTNLTHPQQCHVAKSIINTQLLLPKSAA